MREVVLLSISDEKTKEEEDIQGRTHLRFDIELCKLLLIPLLTVVIARIHPHLHLSIQPCINLGGRVDAMGGELNGGLEIIGDGVGFGNGGTDVVVCGCHGRIRCTT